MLDGGDESPLPLNSDHLSYQKMYKIGKGKKNSENYTFSRVIRQKNEQIPSL